MMVLWGNEKSAQIEKSRKAEISIGKCKFNMKLRITATTNKISDKLVVGNCIFLNSY